MTDPRGPYRAGAFFIGLSAALHFVTLIFGFQPPVPFMQGVGVFYLAVMMGLMQGWRWLAYLAFLMLMIGGIAALGWSFSIGPIPPWLFVSIAIIDWIAAATLFWSLWKAAPAQA